jgi:hypothetical protein
VILLWPVVGLALGITAIVEAVSNRGRRRGSPSLAKAVLLTLSELHGLQVEIRRARGGRVLVWML